MQSVFIPMSQKSSAVALRASLLYGLFAALWILFSDRVLDDLIQDKERLLQLETYKGWAFVAFTGLLLFLIMQQLLQREAQKIADLKKADELTRLQNETLQMIAGGKPLQDTLNFLLRGIEVQSPEMLVSILFLEADGLHLRHGEAPSLAKEYVAAIDRVEIGPKAGSCGTAAYRKSPVFVSDIAQDPLWVDFRHLALPHKLRSCWSTPILDEQKKVLGTFAVYHREPGLPSDSDVRIIEMVTHTAATAIIKERAEKNLRGSEERFRTLVEHASDAIFVHDTEGRLLDVNRSACESLGYSRKELLRMTVTDIQQDLRLEEAVQVWAKLDPGMSQIIGGRHRRKDGTSFPVEVSLTSYEIHGQMVLAAMARNISERKEYEDQLAQSISLLRATIEASSSGLLVVNTAGEVSIYNNRFLEMWRIQPDLVFQNDDRAVLNAVLDQLTEPETYLQRVEQLYQNPEQESHDTLHFKDGRIYDLVSSPQRLGDKIIGRVWSFTDVTEQRRAEKSMRLQSFALEAAANAILITDSDGEIEWVNSAFTLSSGYTLAESVGKNPRLLMRSGKHGKEFYRMMWETILDGKVWHGELTNRRKDGSLYLEEMTITPLHDAQNRITHFVAIKQDITQRRRMEEELRQAVERTQFYMNRMPLAFIAWNRDFSVAEWNHAAEEIFGWSTAEAMNQHAYKLIVPTESQPHVDKIWDQVIKTGDMASHSINENVTKSGRRITCEWRNTPWRDAHGNICGCLSIVSDITERLRIEKDRHNLEAQLRHSQKMEAVGQLSGGIAHDFNNIVTVIQGNAGMLQQPDVLPAKIRDCSTQIARACDRAARLTRQLLMFARKQQMQPVQLNLNETVAQMTTMLQRILGEDIALRSEYAPALPLIDADVGMIEQIILNLALNARDAMPSGGRLTIRTSVEAATPPASPETAPAESRVRLSLTDTGSGIPQEVLPRIFEPFFTTKEVGKGTGLGLAIVYGIVQQHHGEITVNSEPGKGTTFNVSFPIVAGTEAAIQTPESRPVLPSGNETILLVEDEFQLRTFVSDLLQRCGYTVLEAESGPAALKVWQNQRERIHLVLTDIIMPENINGIDLGHQLLTEKPSLKVIYTSGYYRDLGHRETTLVEGINFISKPFKPEVLAQIIRKNLDASPVLN
jgi:PAS domain S-box-containing protein